SVDCAGRHSSRSVRRPPALVALRSTSQSDAVHRTCRLDYGSSHLLQCGSRWNQPAIGVDDRWDHASLHPGIVERGHYQSSRVYGHGARHGNGYGRSVCRGGLCPILYFLGSHVDSDVPSHWCLGRCQPTLRCHQVLSIHPCRKYAPARCHLRFVLLWRAPNFHPPTSSRGPPPFFSSIVLFFFFFPPPS